MARSKSRRSDSGLAIVVLALTFFVFGLVLAGHIPRLIERAHDRMAARTQNSVVHIMVGENGQCSGFVIGANRVLTAQHCTRLHGPFGIDMGAAEDTVDGQPARLIATDENYDLALFETETSRPALRISAYEARQGDHVWSIGYAWGSTLLSLESRMARINVPVMDDFAVCGLKDREDINGMSGGPVVNDAGEVVSMVSRGANGMSCGVGVTLMRAFLLGK